MKFTAPFGHPARGSPLQHTRQRKSGENDGGGRMVRMVCD